MNPSPEGPGEMKEGNMPATRTDIHAPSNFDPAEYSYVGAFDMQLGDPGARSGQLAMFTVFAGTGSEMVLEAFSPVGAEKRACQRLLSQQGFEGGWWERSNQCDHCGARIRYVCVWRHEPTGQHIATGETCASERFELPSRLVYDMKRLRATAKAEREAIERAEKVTEFLAAIQDKTARAMLVSDADFDTMATQVSDSAKVALFRQARGHAVISDIRSRLNEWGTLTERQVAHVVRVFGWVQRDAQTAQAPAEVHVAAPEGRVTVTGTVVSRKYKEDAMYPAWKIILKVTAADGVWLVYMTEPGNIETTRGDIVKVVVTLNPAGQRRDAHFAFGKRPSGAEIVGHDDGAEMEDALA